MLLKHNNLRESPAIYGTCKNDIAKFRGKVNIFVLLFIFYYSPVIGLIYGKAKNKINK